MVLEIRHRQVEIITKTRLPFGWLVGGIRGGVSYGKTDEFGFGVAENPVHVHDLNATVLHLLGLDHERLTYKYQGREFRFNGCRWLL